MKNADMNAFPDENEAGLTKREHACLMLGIPETGSPDLDALIVKSERKRLAAMAMQGVLANPVSKDLYEHEIITTSCNTADALLKALEE